MLLADWKLRRRGHYFTVSDVDVAQTTRGSGCDAGRWLNHCGLRQQFAFRSGHDDLRRRSDGRICQCRRWIEPAPGYLRWWCDHGVRQRWNSQIRSSRRRCQRDRRLRLRPRHDVWQGYVLAQFQFRWSDNRLPAIVRFRRNRNDRLRCVFGITLLRRRDRWAAGIEWLEILGRIVIGDLWTMKDKRLNH